MFGGLCHGFTASGTIDKKFDNIYVIYIRFGKPKHKYYIDIYNLHNIKEPETVKTLNISEFNLTKLPDLSLFTNLEILMCKHNNLKYLPEEITNLTKLKRIICSYNKIEKIPDLHKLENLRVLKCNNNKLKTLPKISKYGCLIYGYHNKYDWGLLARTLMYRTNIKFSAYNYKNCKYQYIEELPDLVNERIARCYYEILLSNG